MLYIKDNVEREAVTDEQAERLKQSGFKPLYDPDPASDETEIPVHSLDDMTVSELKGLAKEKGIEGVSSLNKSQLLEVLKDVV